jgi:hypothetical protein
LLFIITGYKGVDGMIILEWILEKPVGKEGNIFISFRVVTSGGMF